METQAPNGAPVCQIQWIDCHGKPTPHDAPAIGYASLGDKRFAICAAHKRTMDRHMCHHDPACEHRSREPAPWTFEPLEPSA